MRIVQIAIIACLMTSCRTSPVGRVTLFEDVNRLPPLSIEQVNSKIDIDHRARARNLGIMYVDYLHLINTGKLEVLKSYPVMYHRATQ
jgi:hypothetical protein